MSQVQAFLNGEYKPLEECNISPLDRGFIFGDGIYELIPVYNNSAFYLRNHIVRLIRSMREIQIESPFSYAEWETIIEKLIQQSDENNLAVYIQVTRGVAQRDHALPENPEPTIFAMANPLAPISENMLSKGVALITTKDMRWQRCDIKAITLLPNILARQDAVEASAHEAILIRDGYALEGAASNLFVIRDGKAYTHPKDNFILPGITRDVVLEILTESELPFEERPIPEDWLYTSDEIWITSSTKEVLPATKINKLPVGNGCPGAEWSKIHKLYQQHKSNCVK